MSTECQPTITCVDSSSTSDLRRFGARLNNGDAKTPNGESAHFLDSGHPDTARPGNTETTKPSYLASPADLPLLTSWLPRPPLSPPSAPARSQTCETTGSLMAPTETPGQFG
jgi:hypothetical protein